MKQYKVKIAGIEHTLQLSDEDAKLYGDDAKPVEEKGAAPAANKADTAQDK